MVRTLFILCVSNCFIWCVYPRRSVWCKKLNITEGGGGACVEFGGVGGVVVRINRN